MSIKVVLVWTCKSKFHAHARKPHSISHLCTCILWTPRRCRPGIITGDTLWRRKHLIAKGYTVLPVRATEYMDITSGEARLRWVMYGHRVLTHMVLVRLLVACLLPVCLCVAVVRVCAACASASRWHRCR